MKTIANIPFLEIESIPQLIKDFLEQKISGFERYLFTEENIAQQFIDKQKSFDDIHRSTLVETLTNQLSTLDLSEEQKTNLDLLSQKNTFTVTTGHQLNLFTGPVFFIYKILQTIKLAKFLNEKFPDYNVVPVFWMATEDHDFEEISYFKTERNFYEFHGEAGGAVGRITVQNNSFIDDFTDEFKDSVFGTELILLMKKAYKKGNTLAEATRILVHELFSEYGILIVDGDDKKLKSMMQLHFQDELLNEKLFKTTSKTVDFITEKYGKVQVNPREINLFYLSETRNRIEKQNGKFSVIDTDIVFTQEEILKELQSSPEKFSPNALLRPVYQEVMLPNLAYIGGNAEIMYWLELKEYFKSIDLPFPILIPRNSMLFVTEKIQKKAAKFGLDVKDFLQNFSEISKGILLNNSTIQHVLNDKEAKLQNQFSEISEAAKQTDVTFENLVKAEEARQLKSFKRMQKRLWRAEKIKHSEKLEQLEQLFLQIHPGKIWQERQYNFSVFYADFGKEWLQNCYSEMDVQQSELIIAEV